MVGLVIVGISSLSEKPDEVLGGGGGALAMSRPPHRGGRGLMVILQVTSCCRNQEKLQQDGPLGWSTNLFFLVQHIHYTYITLLQAFGMNPTSGE